jgi:GxxExxY protein
MDTKDTKKMPEDIPRDVEALGRQAIDAGLRVHMRLGPGLLESVYEICLAHELRQRGIVVARQQGLPVVYDRLKLEAGYRIDLLLERKVVLEIKSVDGILPVHQAQLLTYLRLSGCRLGFLMNFNVILFRDGLKRFAV